MKKDFIVLTFVFGLIFFVVHPLHADEIQELKTQIKELQSTVEVLKGKIEGLEKKQTKQSEDAGKISKLTKSVEELKTSAAKGLFGEGARLGGHLKLFVFDQSRGKRNDTRQQNNTSAGVSHLYLYIDKELSDKVSISVQPDITVSAGATPALGSNITRTASPSVTTTIYQAFMKVLLPRGFELRAGVFNPYFSDEYASEAWWDEQYHINKGIADIAAWHDNGLELFKNFEFKRWSLPAYFYLLNGDGKFADNNEGQSILIHLAPEISNLRLLSSFGFGKWNDANDCSSRYAGGFEYKHKKLTLRSEYLYKKFEDTLLTGGTRADTEKKGYYIKGLYRFNPKWRGLINYSEVSLPYTGGSSLLKDKYKATTLGLNYFITESSIIMGEVSFVDGRRSDASKKLRYYRSTIGWRTTF